MREEKPTWSFLLECGGVVAAEVSSLGQLFISEPLNLSFECEWRIRTKKNQRVRFLATSSNSYFQSQFYVYDGESRKAPLLAHQGRYGRFFKTRLVSSEQTMTLFVQGSAGDSVVRRLDIFYTAIEGIVSIATRELFEKLYLSPHFLAPQNLRLCDFERDSCGWNLEKSDWTRGSLLSRSITLYVRNPLLKRD